MFAGRSQISYANIENAFTGIHYISRKEFVLVFLIGASDRDEQRPPFFGVQLSKAGLEDRMARSLRKDVSDGFARVDKSSFGRLNQGELKLQCVSGGSNCKKKQFFLAGP